MWAITLIASLACAEVVDGNEANLYRSLSSIENPVTVGNMTAADSSICLTALKIYDHGGYTVYKVNETIKLACSVSTLKKPNISVFYLMHYQTGRRLEPSFQDGNCVVFEIDSATIGAAGRYDCFYGECTKPNPDLTSFTQINVIDLSPPQLECMSINIHNWATYNITCTWSRSGDTYSSCWLLKYASRSLSGILQPFQNCSGTVIMDICEEFYSSQSCSVVVDDFLQSHEYQIQLLENLFIGGRSITSEYTYTIPVDGQIMKANPVIVLNTSAEKPREMALTWQFDGSWSTIVNRVLCNISYESHWRPSNEQFDSFFVEPDLMIYTKILKSLEPFTNYTFIVRIKPVSSPYWSDEAVFEGRTLPEVPVAVPSHMAYSQVLAQNESQRKIFLYWEPLHQRQWYGPNASYIINITCSKHLTRTEEISANTTSHTTILWQLVPSTSSCDLIIQSKNCMGVSDEMATLHIPPLEKDIAPEMVQVKEQEPNVYDVVVMETRSRSAKVKYMLYWCQGYLKMNLPNCVKNYHSLQSDINNWTITVNQSDDHFSWYFGASVQEGNQTSRIVWASEVQPEEDLPLASQGLKGDGDTKVIIIVATVGAMGVLIIFLVVVATRYTRCRERFKAPEIIDPLEDKLKGHVTGGQKVDFDNNETSSLTACKDDGNTDDCSNKTVGDIVKDEDLRDITSDNSENGSNGSVVQAFTHTENEHNDQSDGCDQISYDSKTTNGAVSNNVIISWHYFTGGINTVKDFENAESSFLENISAKEDKQQDCLLIDTDYVTAFNEPNNSIERETQSCANIKPTQVVIYHVDKGEFGESLDPGLSPEHKEFFVQTSNSSGGYIQHTEMSDINSKVLNGNGYVLHDDFSQQNDSVESYVCTGSKTHGGFSEQAITNQDINNDNIQIGDKPMIEEVRKDTNKSLNYQETEVSSYVSHCMLDHPV